MESKGYYFLIYILHGLLKSTLQDSNIMEYCNHESFEAECSPNSVIIMKAAMYGRMRLGRCVKKDLGYVGCQTDVLTAVDKLCSGRHKCSFRVPNLDVMVDSDSKTCMEELKAYLEASYECQQINVIDSFGCQNPESLVIRSSYGVLSSIVSSNTGCGSGSSPWIIEVEKGQRINVTLYDFASFNHKENIYGGTSLQKPCHAYAILRENNQLEAATVCGGHERISQVYISASNKLEVRLFTRKNQNTAHFLLHYQALGCPTPNLSQAYHVEMIDNYATVTCRESKSQWKITCKDLVWNGAIGNCSDGYIPVTGGVVIGGYTLSFEVSIIIISAIAIIISAIILVIGITCIRKRRVLMHTSTSVMENNGTFSKDHVIVKDRNTADIYGRNLPGKDGNEYARILSMPLPPPPEIDYRDISDNFDYQGHNAYPPDYHIYHDSEMDIDAYPPPHFQPMVDHRYFQLDPHNNHRYPVNSWNHPNV